jgi:three-Cys-motif partner protein
MNAFWGDESWRDSIYSTTGTLFDEPRKQSNKVIEEAFRQRLQKVAGYKRVPDPVPMRNSKGAVLYYLFFAAQLDTAEHILLDIFERYRQRGVL